VVSWPGPRSADGGVDHFVVAGEETGIWLCGKRVTGPDPEAAIARVEGVDPDAVAIVCLCEPHELDERYPDYLAWLERNEGTRSMWRRIPDLSAPPIDQARVIAAEMNARLDDGQSLLVHCGAGIGRAPTLSICALLGRGYDLETLIDAVAACRPMAGPETGDQHDLVVAIAAER
jgi:protein-tyrosine phosphatase